MNANPELTREQMRVEHGHLWRWLAKHPDMFKEDWPGWKRLGIDLNQSPYEQACFACAAVSDCNKCPITWSSGGQCTPMIGPESELDLWVDAMIAGDFVSTSRLASKIAKMWPKEK